MRRADMELPAYIRSALRRQCIALADLWFNAWMIGSYTGWRAGDGAFPAPTTIWVYGRDIDRSRECMAGKRIRVTIEIEDWPGGKEG
jgi:hypothetical protein